MCTPVLILVVVIVTALSVRVFITGTPHRCGGYTTALTAAHQGIQPLLKRGASIREVKARLSSGQIEFKLSAKRSRRGAELESGEITSMLLAWLGCMGEYCSMIWVWLTAGCALYLP